MKNYISILVLSIIMLSACNSDNLTSLDLQRHGANISIKAPETAEVSSTDMGLRKEITVKDGQYDIIVSVASEVSDNASVLANKEKASVEGFELFSKIIQEDENGFIFETNEGTTQNYDFRYVHKKNKTAYFFRRNFGGDFTLDEVKTMYKGVQQK